MKMASKIEIEYVSVCNHAMSKKEMDREYKRMNGRGFWYNNRAYIIFSAALIIISGVFCVGLA